MDYCQNQVPFGWETTMCMSKDVRFFVGTISKRPIIRCKRCVAEDPTFLEEIKKGFVQELTRAEFIVHEVMMS